MSATTRETAMSHVTIRTGHCSSLTFLKDADYRRHMLGLEPEGYRPTLGQMRLTRDDLRFMLRVIPGGKAC
jgi:hypothetical protein